MVVHPCWLLALLDRGCDCCNASFLSIIITEQPKVGVVAFESINCIIGVDLVRAELIDPSERGNLADSEKHGEVAIPTDVARAKAFGVRSVLVVKVELASVAVLIDVNLSRLHPCHSERVLVKHPLRLGTLIFVL